jgi:propane monooxygenase reductase subunit
VEAKARVTPVEDLTPDTRRLELQLIEPAELEFHPGQYVDITIPGSDAHRSFSMANLPSDKGRLEFMIKLYPDGRFSGLLDSGLNGGDELQIKGPYGVFTLRDQSPRRLLFIGGGAGMAPILCLLRSLVERGIDRPATYYYGARAETDLFHREELRQLESELPAFRFVPALSEGAWDGESGLITDVVERLEEDFKDVDAYVCGPPPMVEAAQALLMGKGVPESRIYFDKFTTTESEETSRA